MLLNVYAVKDTCADVLVSFRFGSNDSSFVRDNLPSDIYNSQTKRGLPIDNLAYIQIGTVDTESFEIVPCVHRDVDIMRSYKFKTENDLTENKGVDK